MAMKTSMRAALIAATMLALCCRAAAIAKPPAQHDTPVIVHFDAPNSNYDLPLVSHEGWHLLLKITVPYASIDFDNGGGFPRLSDFPRQAGPGYIFFENPDGCYRLDDGSLIFPQVWPHPEGCILFPPGEEPILDDIYIEYHPDVDIVGVEDRPYPFGPRGRDDLRNLLVYSAGSRGPEFSGQSPCTPGTNDSDCARLGPATGAYSDFDSMGGEVLDGWGLGTDDDLPGLFIYTDKGAGLVWQEPEFELEPHAGVRNLAGMANSVSFEVSDLMKVKKSSDLSEEFKIWVDFNVLTKTFQSVVQFDGNNGMAIDPANQLWRIDGGDVEPIPPEIENHDPLNPNSSPNEQAAAYLITQQKFTVKAFMVSGTAPAELFDANGDGNYVDDAEAAGYTVLSNVAEISFLQIPETVLCAGSPFNVVYSDLDDNGLFDAEEFCSKGPTALRDAPR